MGAASVASAAAYLTKAPQPQLWIPGALLDGGEGYVQTIGRIRREYFLKGKTIRQVARDLRVSRNTARKVLRSGETVFEYERDEQPRPKLGAWTADLEELLRGNAEKAEREQRFQASP